MGKHAREVASLIGVSCEGSDKDIKAVICKIQKRWLFGLARDIEGVKSSLSKRGN